MRFVATEIRTGWALPQWIVFSSRPNLVESFAVKFLERQGIRKVRSETAKYPDVMSLLPE
jgi:hypothetical protein